MEELMKGQTARWKEPVVPALDFYRRQKGNAYLPKATIIWDFCHPWENLILIIIPQLHFWGANTIFLKVHLFFFFLEISTSNMGLKLTTPVIKSHIFYWLSQLGVPSVVTATNHLPFLDSIHIQRLYSHHQLSSTEAKYFFLISQVY